MSKKCFVVEYHYLDGEHEYSELSFIRATEKQLERHVNRDLADFSRRKTSTWTVNGRHDEVLESDAQRVLSVAAEEVASFDSVPARLVTELRGEA